MTATKSWRNPTLVLATLAVAVLVAGCCSLGISKCKTTDQLTFITDKSLNSCSGDGYSYPVTVRVFYLSQPGPFESASFQDLWDNNRETLGASLVEEAPTVTLTPDGQVTQPCIRPAGAAYLGIVANFCRLDEGTWREVVPLAKGLNATVTLKNVDLSVD